MTPACTSLCHLHISPRHSIVQGFPRPFADQFQLYASHGVIVSAHGAGLSNLMFMPAMSALVELFPYHIDHTLYATLAMNMHIASYPVHAINGSIIWENDPPYFEHGCDEMTVRAYHSGDA